MPSIDSQPPPDPGAGAFQGDVSELYQQGTGVPLSKSQNDSVPGTGRDTIQGALTQEEAMDIYQQATGASLRPVGATNAPGSISQGNTVTASKYHDAMFKQYDTPPEKPKLPYSNAPAPETSGNQWLNTAAMNKFYSLMKERARQQMFMQLLGSQNSILAQKSIEETGRDKAESQLIQGMETFVKEIIAGCVAAVGAVAGAVMLGKSRMEKGANDKFNKKVEEDPMHGLSPQQRETYTNNENRIRELQNKPDDNSVAGSAEHMEAQKMKQKDQAEIAKLENRNSEMRTERDRAQSTKHGNANSMIQTQTQLIQQMTQAATSLSNAVFDLLISFEQARQTMDDTTNQLNQSFLDSQQKAQQAAVDDFNQAIQNMVDTSRSYAQSISFKAA